MALKSGWFHGDSTYHAMTYDRNASPFCGCKSWRICTSINYNVTDTIVVSIKMLYNSQVRMAATEYLVESHLFKTSYKYDSAPDSAI